MKRYAIAALCGFFIANANAETLYMPNAFEGFIILTDEPCAIEPIADKFPRKALNEITEGGQSWVMEGCGVLHEAPPDVPRAVSTVSIFMFEEGSPNIGNFNAKLFSTKKERWDEQYCDRCGTL